LPATLATSLALGVLLWEGAWERIPIVLHPLVAVLPLALVRWLTLPGAMVPRHRPPDEPFGRLDTGFALLLLGWALYLLLLADARVALRWLALFVVVFHVLGVARRRRAGRYALLTLAALLCVPLGASRAATTWSIPALSLALGAGFTIPWLRRADKRAGLLAALGFASLLATGPLLFAAGACVFVLASHPRQRRFAALSLAAWAVPFALVLARKPSWPPRDRLLSLPMLVERALTVSEWGLAWPLVAAALVLGALRFPWRAREWTPGTIDEPRREVQALLVLLVLACVVLALPLMPWDEGDVLILLFPLCTLLAGLLLIPPERARG
jgi:hypothetical protein